MKQTDDRTVDAKDKFVFWTSLYVASLTWLVFTFIAIIKLSLDYLLICVIALTLLGSNIVGYVKCSKGMYHTNLEFLPLLVC